MEDNFDTLIQEILENPEKLLDKNVVSDDDVLEIKRRLNVYKAPEVSEQMKMGLIAYTNFREEYLKKFVMTSMIAFLYRGLHENGNPEPVREFLDQYFKFNPDEHVRSANKNAPKKHDPFNPMIKNKELEAITLPRPSVTNEHIECIFSCNENYNTAVRALKNRNLREAINYCAQDSELSESLMRIDENTRGAIHNIPPQDSFHRLTHYMEVHYEQLRSITDALYNERAELELAINILEDFEGTEDQIMKKYNDYIKVHRKTLMNDVKLIRYKGWTYLGEYKKNRDCIDYYNKNTEILKRIIEQHESDKQIGEELLKHKITKLKAENIRESGPDAPELNEYKSVFNGAKSAGAKEMLTKEDRLRLEKARGDLKAYRELEVLEECETKLMELTKIKETREWTDGEMIDYKNELERYKQAKDMINVPDDAIQVDTFVHDTKNNKLLKSHFYTKSAEALDEVKDEEKCNA